MTAALAHSVHIDGVTVACRHKFRNKSQRPILVKWVDFDGVDVQYHELRPGQASPQCTSTTHLWRIYWGHSKTCLGEHVGPSSLLEVDENGLVSISPLQIPVAKVQDPQRAAAWGVYRVRGAALGITIKAYDCVGDAAVQRAQSLLTNIMRDCSQDIIDRLVDTGACVAIIGRSQVTTDIPEHDFMKMAEGVGAMLAMVVSVIAGINTDERDIDATTRGLGGTQTVPVTSCGEENLTMQDDTWYPSENILVHEWAHTVMLVGLGEELRADIHSAHAAAYEARLYDHDAYIMANADEYWAEASQAWFEATIRMDATGGITTRAGVRSRDPRLAQLLELIWGDGPWRFHHDSPAPLGTRQSLAMAAAGESGDTAANCTSSGLQPDVHGGRISAGGSGVVGEGEGVRSPGEHVGSTVVYKPTALQVPVRAGSMDRLPGLSGTPGSCTAMGMGVCGCMNGGGMGCGLPWAAITVPVAEGMRAAARFLGGRNAHLTVKQA